jgi:hypothetical protein
MITVDGRRLTVFTTFHSTFRGKQFPRCGMPVTGDVFIYQDRIEGFLHIVQMR